MTRPASLVTNRANQPTEQGDTMMGIRIATALAATVVALAASPAAADAAAPRQNCVGDLTGRTPMRCFATFTEAMAAASGGRYTDAPATGAKALADASFDAKVDAANAGTGASRAVVTGDIVISIEYDLSDYDSDDGYLIWSGDKECTTRTTDVDYEVGNYNVSAPLWVNRITSFRTYGNCWAKHFEDPGLDGASVGFEGSRSYIGAAMDNRTSSEQWS